MSESSPELVPDDGPHMQEQSTSPLASLVVPHSLHSSSRPATAATSMMTIVPNDDEKNDEASRRPSGEHATSPEQDTAAAPSSPAMPMEPPIPQTPQISLKLLLISGTRKVMSFDATTTVSRVKELIWNGWQSGELKSPLFSSNSDLCSFRQIGKRSDPQRPVTSGSFTSEKCSRMTAHSKVCHRTSSHLDLYSFFLSSGFIVLATSGPRRLISRNIAIAQIYRVLRSSEDGFLPIPSSP